MIFFKCSSRQGACGSCPSSMTTMTMGIKRRLMEKIPVQLYIFAMFYQHQCISLLHAPAVQHYLSLVARVSDANKCSRASSSAAAAGFSLHLWRSLWPRFVTAPWPDACKF